MMKKAFHLFIAQNKKITAKELKRSSFLQRLALILLHPDIK